MHNASNATKGGTSFGGLALNLWRYGAAAIGLVIGACTATTTQTSAEMALADAVFSAVVSDSSYRSEASIKAMAACIDWPTEINEPAQVSFTPWTHLSVGSDGSLPIGEMSRDALDRCYGFAASNNLSCECQVVALNDKNVVEVPAQLKPSLEAAPASYTPARPELSNFARARFQKEPIQSADFDTCISSSARPSDAIAACTKYIEDPKNSDEDKAVALYNRAVEYRRQNNISGALADTAAALEINPKVARVHNLRGLAYSENKRDDELALLEFGKAIELDSDYVYPVYNRGRVFQRQKKYLKAIEEFNRAISIDPMHESSYYRLNFSRRAIGQPLEALAGVNRAIELDQGFSSAHLLRARILMDLESVSEAEDAFSDAIAAGSTDGNSHNERAYARLAIGDIDSAYSDVKTAVSKQPENKLFQDTLGDVECRRGNASAALATWQRAFAGDPDSIDFKRDQLAAIGLVTTEQEGVFGESSENALRTWAEGGCKRLCVNWAPKGNPIGKDGKKLTAGECISRLD